MLCYAWVEAVCRSPGLLGWVGTDWEMTVGGGNTETTIDQTNRHDITWDGTDLSLEEGSGRP